jgi:hypothetical protein
VLFSQNPTACPYPETYGSNSELPTLYYTSIHPWLYSPCGPWPLFQFLNLYTVGRTPWTGDQPVSRPLPTHRTTQKQNKHTQTSLPRVRFETIIPAFERAKRVHALDRSATVIASLSQLFYYCSPIYVYISQTVFSLHAFRAIFYIHFYAVPMAATQVVLLTSLEFYISMISGENNKLLSSLFWNMKQCNLVEICRCFG